MGRQDCLYKRGILKDSLTCSGRKLAPPMHAHADNPQACCYCLAEPPHLLMAATRQVLYLNSSVLGGMKLCIGAWQFILQKSALWAGTPLVQLCALRAACPSVHPLMRRGLPLAMLCAYPGLLFMAVGA